MSSEGGVVTVLESLFLGNRALGEGGGALFNKQGRVILGSVSAANNSALNGGGGAVLWQVAAPSKVSCDVM